MGFSQKDQTKHNILHFGNAVGKKYRVIVKTAQLRAKKVRGLTTKLTLPTFYIAYDMLNIRGLFKK